MVNMIRPLIYPSWTVLVKLQIIRLLRWPTINEEDNFFSININTMFGFSTRKREGHPILIIENLLLPLDRGLGPDSFPADQSRSRAELLPSCYPFATNL